MLPCLFGLFWPLFGTLTERRRKKKKKEEHLRLLDLSASPQVKMTKSVSVGPYLPHPHREEEECDALKPPAVSDHCLPFWQRLPCWGSVMYWCDCAAAVDLLLNVFFSSEILILHDISSCSYNINRCRRVGSRAAAKISDRPRCIYIERVIIHAWFMRRPH